MTIEQFKSACSLVSLTEVDKACYLAFFHMKANGIEEFTAADAARWLVACGSARPNQSRLDERLRVSRNTVRGQRGFRLSLKFSEDLQTRFPALGEKSQDIVDAGTILPEPDYRGTRGYIESLAKQINAAYEHNIFDGCAILMRRLVEILLILSYRKLHIQAEIQDSAGNFEMLDGIIKNAKNNITLALSRNSKSSLDIFRELGNFSAHKIEYTCHREYIQPHILAYRALITELLYKSGIRI
jgi:hypothetical protein